MGRGRGGVTFVRACVCVCTKESTWVKVGSKRGKLGPRKKVWV